MHFKKRKRSLNKRRKIKNQKRQVQTQMHGLTPKKVLRKTNHLFQKLAATHQWARSNLKKNQCQRKKHPKFFMLLPPSQSRRKNLKHKSKRKNMRIERRPQMSSLNRPLNLSRWISMLKIWTISLLLVNKQHNKLMIRSNQSQKKSSTFKSNKVQKTCLSNFTIKRRTHQVTDGDI